MNEDDVAKAEVPEGWPSPRARWRVLAGASPKGMSFGSMCRTVIDRPSGTLGRQCILVIEDSGDPPGRRREYEAAGPAGFHEPVLRRVLGAATAVAIVPGEPPLAVYQAAPRITAERRWPVILVECTATFEDAWREAVRQYAPRAELLDVTAVANEADAPRALS